ncbi:[FeFe] hydrogenase H-cluster maturation GTPase HydF [uncultured Propionivibrio sp.]|uniref:[FeFe] hydrogenase H-cluster maturation GTPase HydF n=1 Tax=uncultured Propionivibrio sp. TaxID=426737 RepID=UPI0029C0B9C9|nr:[FeFe] hydrogenase H-cluster maturation GTPase HydF [uncultured Propionivibrio sp.]
MLETPKGLRLHIGIFGRRNSGKSTLMNALIGQSVSIVSDQPGTTTDPVEKTFELAPLGPVVFIDTAGLDDEGDLGALRIEKTRQVLERVDVALIVVDAGGMTATERDLMATLRAANTPFAVVFNKSDLGEPPAEQLAQLAADAIETVSISAATGLGIDRVKEALFRQAPESSIEDPRLVGDLIGPGDLVVLVVPIDLGAPKGRLILPQVQTMRDILDSDAVGLMVKERELAAALARMSDKPRLVVCDSQVVNKVSADTPPDIRMTTFSILMARFKGDMIGLAEGAGAISRLKPGDKVLIAEACSHHALADDIGRVKIPRWLRQYAGGNLDIEVRSGKDFPEDLSSYALIVQCGGCTVTRKQILVRQYRAAQQGVPMTNYGMAISVSQGVIERALECFPAAQDAYRRGMAGNAR